MLSPNILGFLAGLSVFLIIMGILRPKESLFAITGSDSLKQNLEVKLRRAGIVDTSLSVLLFGLTLVTGLVFTIALFLTASPFGAGILAGLVPVAAFFELDRRSRKWQEKVTIQLVPFLRKIESQVRVGQNPTRAFATAVNEDPLLRYILSQQLRDLEFQRPFQEVLKESLQVVPLRPWVQFVRSMDAFSESGGQLADILSNNVSRINSQILLRQRLMGDLAQYRGQQIIILVIAVVVPILMYSMAGSMMGSVFSSSVGIIGLFVAICLDLVALWITQKAVKDVESKLEA